MGPAGSGKSTLVTQYARCRWPTRESASPVTFLKRRARTFSIARPDSAWTCGRTSQNGRVTMDQIDPAEISPGEFANRVRTAVESGTGDNRPRVIIIDSLNGYLNAMPSENFLLIQMHELLMYLNERGVLTLMVLAQHGLMGSAMQTPVDVTYLADTVIVLRYFEAFGEVRQAHGGREEADGRP